MSDTGLVPDAVLQGIEQQHGQAGPPGAATIGRDASGPRRSNFAAPPTVPDTFSNESGPFLRPGQPDQPAGEPAAQAAVPPAPVITPGGENLPPQLRDSINPLRIVVRPLPRDRSSLDAVMGAVWQTESGDEHADAAGKVKRSAKGALGASGLMPGTARDLGVDPMDEAQNREGGRRYLSQMYDKYDNWDDALAAYNWGPGNVDKWIASGREPGRMPAETRQYVETTLRRAGMSETAGTAVAKAKRRIGTDELDEMDRAIAAGRLGVPLHEAMAASDNGLSLMFDEQTSSGVFDVPVEAFAHGVRRGLQGTVTGPMQAVLEQTSPDAAQALTNRLNDFESQFEHVTSQHPAVTFAGDIVGTTVGVMMAGRMLGPLGAAAAVRGIVPAAAARMGLVTRSTAIGAALGATTYNERPEEASRVAEGVLGGALGLLGGAIGKSVIWGAKTLADNATYTGFIGALRDTVGELTPSTTRLKDLFLDRYERLWQQKNELYTMRNAAGEALPEGFPREPVAAGVMEAMTASRMAGVAPTATTRSVAASVDRELGGPAARAAEAEHAIAVKEWEKATAKAQAERAPFGVQTEAIRRAEATGQLSPMPTHPGEFEPPPISAEQFSAAVQAVNRAWSRAASDPTTRTQLRMMTQRMLSGAEAAAREAGMSVDSFMRQATAAGKFFRTEIGPIYERFRRQTPAQIRGESGVAFSGVPTAKFFDDAVRLIEGHDMEALRSFAKMVGPAAKPELIRIAAYRMLQAIEKPLAGAQAKTAGPAGMIGYVRQHQEALQTLVGRDGIEQLKGYANIAQRIAEHPITHRKLLDMHNNSWLKYLGGLEVMEGAIHASPRRMLWGAGLAVTPYATHLMFNTISRLQRLPTILPLVQRAAKTRPDSPEMETVVREIERRVTRLSGVVAREATPAANAAGSIAGLNR